MDNKRQELMDTLHKIFSDEASTEAIMKAETVEEIQNIMENKELSFSRKDCEFLLAVREENFVRSLSEMKNNEEVQAALKEKGFMLSLDECAMLRLITNKVARESLTKARNTEEVRNILEENGIALSPEAYSNLEWNLEVDVELSEDELTNVTGGGWRDWTLRGLIYGALGSFAVAGILAVLTIIPPAIGFGVFGLGCVIAGTIIQKCTEE